MLSGRPRRCLTTIRFKDSRDPRLEVLFLSLARKEVHDLADLRPVDSELAKRFISSDMVRTMTLAPELVGAKEAIRSWFAETAGGGEA